MSCLQQALLNLLVPTTPLVLNILLHQALTNLLVPISTSVLNILLHQALTNLLVPISTSVLNVLLLPSTCTSKNCLYQQALLGLISWLCQALLTLLGATHSELSTLSKQTTCLPTQALDTCTTTAATHATT